jgi:hypothetical protein
MATFASIPSQEASAVGGGLPFTVDEGLVPGAKDNMLNADSLDLTYHACTEIGGQNNMRLRETGYFWNSSYQDVDSVVDSQINYFDIIAANGYHMYGIYTYEAGRVPPAQPTPTGDRLNYVVAPNNAAISLYVDPNQDTVLALNGCQVVITNNVDDMLVGTSAAVAQGEKSETGGLANGDFKVVFSNWVWGPAGNLFGAPANAIFLVFNGNLTSLGGALAVDHSPEGSGNIFWLEEFQHVDGND